MTQINSLGGPSNLGPAGTTDVQGAPDVNRPAAEAPQTPPDQTGQPTPAPSPASRNAEQQIDAAGSRARVDAKAARLPGRKDLPHDDAVKVKREVYEDDKKVKDLSEGRTSNSPNDIPNRRTDVVQGPPLQGHQYFRTNDGQFRVDMNVMYQVQMAGSAKVYTDLPGGAGKICIEMGGNTKGFDPNGMPVGDRANITVVNSKGEAYTLPEIQVTQRDAQGNTVVNLQQVYDTVAQIKKAGQ